MASNTPNLNLYKKDPTIDGNDTFNIKTMLNDNWDKIDTEVAKKANQKDFNSHLADSTSHVTGAERIAWNSKAERTYVDEQIQTVTATGIPKLVSYEYDLYATTDNQTVFTIPYDYFNSATDTLMVEVSGIDVPKSYYTVTNPVTNGDNSITKGYITLNEGRPKDSFLKMRILRNVPIGPDGAIQGTVLTIDSIPQNRVQGLVDLNNNFVSHKADYTKHVSKNGTLQTGLNSEKINGKTASATPVTNEKIDLIGMVNEAFISANNGKTSVANAIGLPSTATEIFSQLANDINTQKNNLATNLTNKGQSSSGTDTLANLVSKVSNINTGKRFASGTGHGDGTYYNYLTVTGLSFTPSIVIVRNLDSKAYWVLYDSVINNNAYYFKDGTGTLSEYIFGVRVGDKVLADGFKFSTYNANLSWIAIE
jgi:hypothetical protein